MKYTLLDIVKNILSSLDSDEVESINDTTESQQVALIVRGAFYDLQSRLNLPEHFDFFNLTSTVSASTPVTLYLPTNVSSVSWLKYDLTKPTDENKNIKELVYLPLDQFTELSYSYAASQEQTQSYVVPRGSYNINLYCVNTRGPSYYSVVNDSVVLFDSFDSETESYITASKITGYGKLQYDFPLLDTFTPSLDEQQFQLLVNEAKGTAWVELKQTANERAEKKVRQHLIASQKNKRGVGTTNADFKSKLPDYGRKR